MLRALALADVQSRIYYLEQADDNDPLNHKRPLAYHELRDIIDLSLWAGQMLLQHGATSQRVEESVHKIGTGLGCDWLDILVSPNVITITASSGSEFRTKLRRVVSLGVSHRWPTLASKRDTAQRGRHVGVTLIVA